MWQLSHNTSNYKSDTCQIGCNHYEMRVWPDLLPDFRVSGSAVSPHSLSSLALPRVVLLSHACVICRHGGSCYLMLFWSIIVFTCVLTHRSSWETHSSECLLVWVSLQGAWRWCRKTNVIFTCTNLVVNTGLKVAFGQLPFGVHVCETLLILSL